MRRLTAGEIAAVAAELGAVPVGWPADPADPVGPADPVDPADPVHPAGPVGPGGEREGPADPLAAVAATQPADSLAGAVAALLVAIVWGRPFDRRNAAVGVAAADLLARLNGHVLVVEPTDGTVALIGRIRTGAARAEDVREWLAARLLPDVGPGAPVVTGPLASRPPLAVRRAPAVRVAPRTTTGARCPWCAMPLRESLAALVLPTGGGPAIAACGGCGLVLPRPHQEV